MKKLNLLELFAGVGGLSLGFEQTGQFNIVGAIELDPVIADSFAKNNPNTKVFIGDICKLDPKKIAKEFNTKIDIIVGGPPCQGFSTRGPCRGRDDGRNYLFKEFFKYTKFFNPKYFVIENVAAIMGTADGYFLNLILNEAEKQGYKVDYDILDARYFGVPQMRRRAIFIGSKKGNAKVPKMNMKNKIVSVWDAISDLAYIESGEGEFLSKYKNKPESKYQTELRKNSKNLYNHIATKHSDVAIQRLAMIPPEKGKEFLPKEHLTKSTFGGTWCRLEKNKVSPTIVTRFDTPSNGQNNHPFLNRSITPREAARIQSFPDNFIFHGNKSSVIKQIGNAVPPRLANAIATEILKAEDE
ncbi:MAG: DNA cytosine methyltransferase [Alphaproteobacteria bacterium]|nr:DNA cytosine methyltransferase [Alphaproteobacteria bacterium]